jgi:glutamate 5-kinase
MRIVVKVGSRSVVGASVLDGTAEPRFEALGVELVKLREAGHDVVLVSSGAVALGRERLGHVDAPKTVAQLQACAAVGQSLLMRGWGVALAPAQVGQLLLSYGDLADRQRFLNARGALDALLAVGAVPIINENDTVAVDELRFGDNDRLAAMVCTLAEADLLVLWTDVEGLLDRDGRRVREVTDLEAARALVDPPKPGTLGSGGMTSKLEAAAHATRLGIGAAIVDARRPADLARLIRGEDVGTRFPPSGDRLPRRKHWIAFTLRPAGDVFLDAGAVRALVEEGRSLLPAGVRGVRGSFGPGDAVALRDAEGREVARGLTRYGTEDLAAIVGARSSELATRLGWAGPAEVVHRDDLVVTASGDPEQAV